MNLPIKLAILSNSGGAGKTTIAINLAYSLSQLGISSCLIDLDPQGSLSLFCGLTPSPSDKTIASVLRSDDFKGDWPLLNVWENHTMEVSLCPGGLVLAQTTQEISLHPRGAYLLQDRLQDFPLPQQLLIFDCPATLGPLTQLALAACTHILIPVQLQPKSVQCAAKLIEWIYQSQNQLRLRPTPEILGLVPNQYDQKRAIERQISEDLPQAFSARGIKCYSPIRVTSEFVNASAAGLPLEVHRPTHKANKDFQPITKTIAQLIKGKNGH